MQIRNTTGIFPKWRIWWAVLIVLFVLSSSVIADTISKVDVQNFSDRIEVKIEANASLGKHTPIISTAGKFIGFEFPYNLSCPGKLVYVKSGWIHTVRYNLFKSNPHTTRVIINTGSHLDYNTDFSDDRKTMTITVWKHGQTPKKTEKSAKAVKSSAQVSVMADVKSIEPAKTEMSSSISAPLAALAAPVIATPPITVTSEPEILVAGTSEIYEKPLSEIPGEHIAQAIGIRNTNGAENSSEPKTTRVPERRVSLNFLGADINDVLKALSVQSGKNVVAGKDVTGTITVSLRDVTLTEALDYVTKLSGYSYVEQNGTYLVGGKDSLNSFIKRDEVVEDYNLITEIYKVKHVDAIQLADTIKTLVPSVNITFAPTDGFDLQAPQAITFQSATGAVVQQPTQQQKSDIRPRTLIITGVQNDINRSLELAKKLDVKSPQIKIEAKVTSISESGERKLGLLWDWGSNSTTTDGIIRATEKGEEVEVGQIFGRGIWGRNPFGFQAKLEALITNGDATLLAAPNIVSVEGKPGTFFVGDEVRYIIRVEQTSTGSNVITETANVGIQLRAIGQVNTDGTITLNLHPEVSVIRLEFNPTANINLPIITRRFTDHTVRVNDGETIVIGGLIRNDEIQTLKKVPLLGDIPFLGQLFRHTEKSNDKSEVVIFITASVLKD
ncbi:MAG: secretin and TonB N-terminal domain-containing protein [Armatimonadota bacterium]